MRSKHTEEQLAWLKNHLPKYEQKTSGATRGDAKKFALECAATYIERWGLPKTPSGEEEKESVVKEQIYTWFKNSCARGKDARLKHQQKKRNIRKDVSSSVTEEDEGDMDIDDGAHLSRRRLHSMMGKQSPKLYELILPPIAASAHSPPSSSNSLGNSHPLSSNWPNKRTARDGPSGAPHSLAHGAASPGSASNSSGASPHLATLRPVHPGASFGHHVSVQDARDGGRIPRTDSHSRPDSSTPLTPPHHSSSVSGMGSGPGVHHLSASSSTRFGLVPSSGSHRTSPYHSPLPSPPLTHSHSFGRKVHGHTLRPTSAVGPNGKLSPYGSAPGGLPGAQQPHPAQQHPGEQHSNGLSRASDRGGNVDRHYSSPDGAGHRPASGGGHGWPSGGGLGGSTSHERSSVRDEPYDHYHRDHEYVSSRSGASHLLRSSSGVRDERDYRVVESGDGQRDRDRDRELMRERSDRDYTRDRDRVGERGYERVGLRDHERERERERDRDRERGRERDFSDRTGGSRRYADVDDEEYFHHDRYRERERDRRVPSGLGGTGSTSVGAGIVIGGSSTSGYSTSAVRSRSVGEGRSERERERERERDRDRDRDRAERDYEKERGRDRDYPRERSTSTSVHLGMGGGAGLGAVGKGAVGLDPPIGPGLGLSSNRPKFGTALPLGGPTLPLSSLNDRDAQHAHSLLVLSDPQRLNSLSASSATGPGLNIGVGSAGRLLGAGIGVSPGLSSSSASIAPGSGVGSGLPAGNGPDLTSVGGAATSRDQMSAGAVKLGGGALAAIGVANSAGSAAGNNSTNTASAAGPNGSSGVTATRPAPPLAPFHTPPEVSLTDAILSLATSAIATDHKGLGSAATAGVVTPHSIAASLLLYSRPQAAMHALVKALFGAAEVLMSGNPAHPQQPQAPQSLQPHAAPVINHGRLDPQKTTVHPHSHISTGPAVSLTQNGPPAIVTSFFGAPSESEASPNSPAPLTSGPIVSAAPASAKSSSESSSAANPSPDTPRRTQRELEDSMHSDRPINKHLAAASQSGLPTPVSGVNSELEGDLPVSSDMGAGSPSSGAVAQRPSKTPSRYHPGAGGDHDELDEDDDDDARPSTPHAHGDKSPAKEAKREDDTAMELDAPLSKGAEDMDIGESEVGEEMSKHEDVHLVSANEDLETAATTTVAQEDSEDAPASVKSATSSPIVRHMRTPTPPTTSAHNVMATNSTLGVVHLPMYADKMHALLHAFALIISCLDSVISFQDARGPEAGRRALQMYIRRAVAPRWDDGIMGSGSPPLSSLSIKEQVDRSARLKRLRREHILWARVHAAALDLELVGFGLCEEGPSTTGFDLMDIDRGPAWANKLSRSRSLSLLDISEEWLHFAEHVVKDAVCVDEEEAEWVAGAYVLRSLIKGVTRPRLSLSASIRPGAASALWERPWVSLVECYETRWKEVKDESRQAVLADILMDTRRAMENPIP